MVTGPGSRWWEDVPRPVGWPDGVRSPVWVATAEGGMWVVETDGSRPYVSASRDYGVWCVDWADFGVVTKVMELATEHPGGL